MCRFIKLLCCREGHSSCCEPFTICINTLRVAELVNHKGAEHYINMINVHSLTSCMKIYDMSIFHLHWVIESLVLGTSQLVHYSNLY